MANNCLTLRAYIYIQPSYVYVYLHSWADSLFRLGCRRSLDQSDLFVHPEEVDSERLLNSFNR